jgi:hypothetical protein
MYDLLVAVIGRISVTELRTDLLGSVAAALGRDKVRRGEPSGEPDDSKPVVPPELTEALATRAESDLPGDQVAVTRRSIRQAQDTAAKIQEERLRQARLSFLVALVTSVAGMVVILCGLVAVLTGVVTAGVVTVVSGTVCEAVGLLAFALNRQANDRLDAIRRDLTLLTNTVLVVELVGGLSDKRLQDRAIADAIRVLTRDNGRPRSR